MTRHSCCSCEEATALPPSGGMFNVGRCEVYPWTRSRGRRWMIVAQELSRHVAVTGIDEPTRRPVVDALERMMLRQPAFRAVLLRADDEACAVVKALDYFRRVDQHVYGIPGDPAC